MISTSLIATFLVAALFSTLAPIAIALFVRRRLHPAWKWIALGAGAFAASQLFTRVPAVVLIAQALGDRLKQPVTQWVWIAALCITAGLFEETARWLCFRYPMKDAREWRNAIALGVGHGGIESIVMVGLSQLGSIVTILLINAGKLGALVPADKAAALDKVKETFVTMSWWTPLLAVWERGVSLTFHIAASVLVLQTFVRGQRRWYWMSVALHAASNAAAVIVMKLEGAVWAEVALTPFWILSAWIIARFRDTPVVARSH